jgi:hypothetical protein
MSMKLRIKAFWDVALWFRRNVVTSSSSRVKQSEK